MKLVTALRRFWLYFGLQSTLISEIKRYIDTASIKSACVLFRLRISSSPVPKSDFYPISVRNVSLNCPEIYTPTPLNRILRKRKKHSQLVSDKAEVT